MSLGVLGTDFDVLHQPAGQAGAQAVETMGELAGMWGSNQPPSSW